MKFIFILAGMISLFLGEVRGSEISQFSEFKNFNSTYFNSDTGKPAISFSFEEISKESPSIGFLKLSIPFFCVENLSVQIKMENIESDSLFKDIKEYHQKKAIRFLRARNVKVHFQFKKEENLFITANLMKLNKDGSYKFSGNVKITIDKQIFEYPSLLLFFSTGINYYSLEKQNGQNVLKIFESSNFHKTEVITNP